MKSYKKLKSRKRLNDKRSTIKELHDTKMKEFGEYYETLPTKIEQLHTLESQLKDLDGFVSCEGNVRDTYVVQKEIDDIRKEIKLIEDQTDMLKYLSNVQDIFFKISENDKKTKESENKIPENTKQDFKLKEKINAGIKKYINISESNNVTSMVSEYMAASNMMVSCGKKIDQKNSKFFECDVCHEPLTTNSNECLLVCESCGVTKNWQDPDIPQWSDECDFSKTYRYKKLGYFIEHLYRMQARGCTLIPDFVINNVMMELKKNRVNSNDKINKVMIRSILKSLDMTTYYDNINSIIRTISGKAAPTFPEDLEDKLICMFMRTLQPFEKYKSLIPSRNNYLSYPYAIRKLIEIVAHEENDPNILKFKEFFGLLKSRDKTWEHEKVWKKICEANEWPFIPSI